MKTKSNGIGFIGMIKRGLSYVPKFVSAGVIAPVVKNAEERIAKLERRIERKIFYSLIIGFGGIFLIFALFFFLRESLNWGNALSFFSIGIVVFVVGLLLKLGEDKEIS